MANFTITPGDADTYLNQTAAATNYGSNIMVYTGWLSKTLEMRAILRVDFSADIPAGATIDTATFATYCVGYNETVTGAYVGYRMRTLTRDWVEGEATWTIYKTGNNWGTAGCRNAANDYDSSVSFGSYASQSAPAWTSCDCKDFMQDAVDNRSRVFDCVLYNNAIMVDDADLSYYWFYSADNVGTWWKITGTYTAAGGAASRNQGYVLGSKLGLHLPSLPRGWMRRRGLLLPVGA